MPDNKPSPENTFKVALDTSTAAAKPQGAGQAAPTKPGQPGAEEPDAAKRREETAKAARVAPDPA